MGSRIIFLGTAGDSMTYGKQSRASGGIVVIHEDMQLVINPGPGALAKARQYEVNLRETSAILVARNTVLAANDVNACIDAMTNGGLDKKGVVICSPSVVDGNNEFHPAISPFHKNCIEKIITLKPGDRVAIDTVEIVPTVTSHPDPTNMGFKITTPQFVVSYVGDTEFDKRLLRDHKGSEILILNIPHPAGKTDIPTLSIEDAIKLAEEIKPKLIVVTGFGVKMLEADILNQVRAIQWATKIQTTAAKDGLIVDPVSFSSIIRQQKLTVD